MGQTVTYWDILENTGPFDNKLGQTVTHFDIVGLFGTK
jgi:hypothetical protein